MGTSMAKYSQEKTPSQSAAPKVVWSKQPGVGIVERCPPMATPNQKYPMHPPFESARTPSTNIVINENATPAKPSQQFPSQAQAVLIEGYVFPRHKEKRAVRAARILARELEEHNSNHDQETSLSSDMSESSEDDSEEDDRNNDHQEDEASDCSDGDTNVYSAKDLSPFASMWWKVSEMVTPETLGLVAQWYGHRDSMAISTTISKRSTTATATQRGTHHHEQTLPLSSQKTADETHMSRFYLFGSFLMRQMPTIAATSGLVYDRRIQSDLQDLIQTFHLYRALESQDNAYVCTIYDSS